jgi:MFS family permease
MLAYLAVALVTSGYFGGMALLQPGVFAVLGIENAAQGDLAGKLGAVQELTFIALAGVFGVLSERFGRGLIYAGGLAVAALGYALFPHATGVGELFLFRFVFAVGGAALVAMLVTVIADYASDHHRGKANGLQGFVVVLGAFIPFALSMVPRVLVEGGASQADALRAAYLAMAALGVVAAALAGLGIRGGSRGRPERVPLLVTARRGLAAARDPEIALAYAAAFISRGDLAVTGAFMMLWASQTARGELGLDIAGAQGAAGGVMGITIVGALIGSVAMGLVADRVSRLTAVALSSALGACVYLGVTLLASPFAAAATPLLLAMGMAELGAFVASQALVGERAPADNRGAVVGLFGAAGAVGMLVGTVFGGKLYSHVGPTAPFALFGGLNLVVLGWALLVRRRLATGERRATETGPETSPFPRAAL